MHANSTHTDAVRPDGQMTWQAILAASDYVRAGGRPPFAILPAQGQAQVVNYDTTRAILRVEEDGNWQFPEMLTQKCRDLLELYLPLATFCAGRTYAIGHLGQSLDGRIATAEGDSHYVTSAANLDHLHRLRALCDAVVVGAGTVRYDDPQLTVRRVQGRHPVRVVIDTNRSLGPEYRLFNDGQAPTLLFCGSDCETHATLSQAEVIRVARRGTGLDMRAVLDALAMRGLHRVFVEGGGITVSRFLEQGCLQRLQIAIAPLVLGAGRLGISFEQVRALRDGLRPPTRHFRQGDDMLFDCDLANDCA